MPRRLADLDKLDRGWLEKRDLINEVDDGKMMARTFQTAGFFFFFFFSRADGHEFLSIQKNVKLWPVMSDLHRFFPFFNLFFDVEFLSL